MVIGLEGFGCGHSVRRLFGCGHRVKRFWWGSQRYFMTCKAGSHCSTD